MIYKNYFCKAYLRTDVAVVGRSLPNSKFPEALRDGEGQNLHRLSAPTTAEISFSEDDLKV